MQKLGFVLCAISFIVLTACGSSPESESFDVSGEEATVEEALRRGGTTCSTTIGPVCAVKRKVTSTYATQCDAEAAGATVVHTGDCDCRDLRCSTGSTCSACIVVDQYGVDSTTYQCIGSGASC